MKSFCRSALAAVLMAAMAGAGCTSTPTTPSVATTNGLTFTNRLLVGGSGWKSFTQTSAGIVTARLSILSPDNTLTVRIGIGHFDGTACTDTIITADAIPDDTNPQLQVALLPGRYCVQIWDIGNLTAMTDFSIVVIQP